MLNYYFWLSLLLRANFRFHATEHKKKAIILDIRNVLFPMKLISEILLYFQTGFLFFFCYLEATSINVQFGPFRGNFKFHNFVHLFLIDGKRSQIKIKSRIKIKARRASYLFVKKKTYYKIRGFIRKKSIFLFLSLSNHKHYISQYLIFL